MGCGSSKSETGTVNNNIPDYRNIPAEEDHYPPPYSPETTKKEIYDPEVNADLQNEIDKLPQGVDKNYTTLLKHLLAGTTKEVHRVTSIYLWMKKQDYQSPALDTEKLADTPRGFMKHIKQGDADLTTFFTILCRRSNIPCVIISGLGKDNEYYIGAPETDLSTRWCAVHVDKEWRLVHVEWCIDGIKDNNQNDSQDQSSDFFFFTDPEDFVTFCLPENYRWQLLKQAYSKKEFLGLPVMRPMFFTLGMSFIQPKSGTLRTHSGKVEIEVTFPRKILDKVLLSYLLSFNKDHEDNDSGSVTIPTALEKYVFMNRKPSRVIFEIFLPVPGRYLFDIYGDIDESGPKKNDRVLDRLCQFRIISDRKFKSGELEPLPESPDIGWGPGPVCKHLGLMPLSHFDSCLFMKPGEVRNIKFKLLRNLDVLAQLTHNYLPLDKLSERVECTQDDGELNVRVQIPEIGQYALKIFCREAGTNEFDEACIYLIRQREPTRLPEKYRDKMLRSKLEHHLNNHTSEKELQKALDMFNCYSVPDTGERKKAEEKLKQYWEIKRELYWCARVRNQHVIRKWVEKARNSKYETDLQEDIQRAENLDDNIGKLNGYTHPIAKLDPHTITEIRNYKRPPTLAHDVMMSTYLLLGEPRAELEEWAEIQYLMGKQSRDSLQRRILDRRPDDVDLDTANEADTVIQGYSMNKCREVSSGVCAFYKWNKQFVYEVRRNHIDEDQQNHLDQQQAGRETFRESISPAVSARSPATTAREPAITESGVGNGVRNEVDNDVDQKPGQTCDEPYAIEDDTKDKYEEKPKRKYFNTSLKPIQKPEETPISYAGWKPANLDFSNNEQGDRTSRGYSPRDDR